VKICLLEPVDRDSATAAKMQQIYSSLKRLGYEVVERGCNKSLLTNVRKDKPDVVFNLSSIYAWDKTYLIPAVLEIAGVRYTGSGILGLSLARNYTKLFPLLFNSGIRVPAFAVITAGNPPSDGLRYPLTLLREGLRGGLSLRNAEDLDRTLDLFPAGEEVLLLEHMAGERVSLFILDRSPFPSAGDQLYLAAVQKAYDVMEARGLARFDFIRSDKPILEWVEIAPDPLDEQFLQIAASAGWDEDRVLQSLVQHSGRDHSLGV
jgi:D-alanine-D-alanine ligase-like ATP-grasp enzyme